jgi:nucleoside-diphosphate-sugar epimerase
MSVHFFTGFPGLVAIEMIQQLFKQGITKEVYAVVLQRELDDAKAIVQLIQQQFKDCKIVLFEGDLTLPILDIADEEFELIQSKIDVVWHLASIQDLTVKRDLAWKVNVHGTANVNEFVCKLPNLKRYMYLSSAFIAGKRKGKILEMELIRPVEFHNFLEETKFEAELLVDNLKLELPITILRPTMIYGYSKLGVKKRDGLYFLSKFISYFEKKRIVPKLGSNQILPTVAIDYVVEASVALCQLPEAEGETVHLTDEKQYDVLTIYTEMARQMTNKNTFGRLPIGIAKVLLEQKSIREAMQVPPQFIDYIDYAAEFDTKDCQVLLSKFKIESRDLMQSLPQIIEYYKENN